MTYLFALMVLLQLADVYTTRRFLAAGKRELNPLIRAGLERFGFWPTMAGKLVVGIGSGLLAYVLGLWWLLAVFCAVLAYVVWNNWRLVE